MIWDTDYDNDSDDDDDDDSNIPTWLQMYAVGKKVLEFSL